VIGVASWHEKVPREPRENLRFRRWLLDECRSDPGQRAVVRQACREDVLFYVNAFVWQYNPILKSTGPFCTWPFQDRLMTDVPPKQRGLLWCYEHGKTAVCEKSRDMGLSWYFLILQDWLCLFHDDVQTFDISRSEAAVDSKSRNSLFAKVRFMHDHLPEWLSGPLVNEKLYFAFKRSGSEITGEASTGRSGAGGRASMVLVDEFSQIKEATKVRQNTASIADCRFFNGTHLGVDTEFYKMTTSPEVVKLVVHWTRHPRKNRHLYSWDKDKAKPAFWRYDEKTDKVVLLEKRPRGFPEDYPYDTTGKPAGGPHPGVRSPWYDRKAADIGSAREVAMELDIDPKGADSQFYDALVIKRLQEKCREPDWTGDLYFTTDSCKPIELVPSVSGSLMLWFTPGVAATGKLGHIPPGDYYVTVDVGTGQGATPTCFSIFNSRIGVKVGAWRSRWKDPKEAAWEAVALARLFRNEHDDGAMLAWETPGPGIAFGNEVLKEIGYRRIYWKTEMFNDEERVSDTPGWFATPVSKLFLHTEYRSALATGRYANYDREALEQCLGYAYERNTVTHPRDHGGDPAAEGQNHGDDVVADGLGWLMAARNAEPMTLKFPDPPPHPMSMAGRRLIRAFQEWQAKSIWQR